MIIVVTITMTTTDSIGTTLADSCSNNSIDDNNNKNRYVITARKVKTSRTRVITMLLIITMRTQRVQRIQYLSTKPITLSWEYFITKNLAQNGLTKTRNKTVNISCTYGRCYGPYLAFGGIFSTMGPEADEDAPDAIDE